MNKLALGFVVLSPTCNSADEKLLKDFAIFARGDKETDKTSDKYKNAVLVQFNKLGYGKAYETDSRSSGQIQQVH